MEKGSLTLESEMQLMLMQGVADPLIGRRWSSSDSGLAAETDLSVSEYVKNNGNQVSHCQRREFQIRKGRKQE